MMRATWWITAVICAAAIVSILWPPIDGRRFALLGFPVLFLVGAWLAYGRPAVRLDESELVLINPFTDVRIPWSAITSTKTDYGLELRADGSRFTAWALADMSLGRRRKHAQDPVAARSPEVTAVMNRIELTEFTARVGRSPKDKPQHSDPQYPAHDTPPTPTTRISLSAVSLGLIALAWTIIAIIAL